MKKGNRPTPAAQPAAAAVSKPAESKPLKMEDVLKNLSKEQQDIIGGVFAGIVLGIVFKKLLKL